MVPGKANLPQTLEILTTLPFCFRKKLTKCRVTQAKPNTLTLNCKFQSFMSVTSSNDKRKTPK